MTTVDAHIEALRTALVTEHEARIAEVEGWADEAAERGDPDAHRRHLAHAERLRAMPYPWQHSAA